MAQQKSRKRRFTRLRAKFKRTKSKSRMAFSRFRSRFRRFRPRFRSFGRSFGRSNNRRRSFRRSGVGSSLPRVPMIGRGGNKLIFLLAIIGGLVYLFKDHIQPLINKIMNKSTTPTS